MDDAEVQRLFKKLQGFSLRDLQNARNIVQVMEKNNISWDDIERYLKSDPRRFMKMVSK